MLDYTALYGIDCGVSPGFGMKYPDYVEREENFKASDDHDSVEKAMEKANEFADDYLSNPETGKTTVTLLNLYGSNGNIKFDKDKSIVERSMLEHLLMSDISE